MSKRKNPNAVALGKRGGRVGGKARTDAKQAAARANGRMGGRPRLPARAAFLKAFFSRMANEPSNTIADMARACNVPKDAIALAFGFMSFADVAVKKAEYDKACKQ